MYGSLMGGFAIFILIVALLIFICAVLEIVMQMFKRSYVEGSQSSGSHYVEMAELSSAQSKSSSKPPMGVARDFS